MGKAEMGLWAVVGAGAGAGVGKAKAVAAGGGPMGAEGAAAGAAVAGLEVVELRAAATRQSLGWGAARARADHSKNAADGNDAQTCMNAPERGCRRGVRSPPHVSVEKHPCTMECHPGRRVATRMNEHRPAPTKSSFDACGQRMEGEGWEEVFGCLYFG